MDITKLWLAETAFLLTNAQWIGLLACVVLGFLADRLTRSVLARVLRHGLARAGLNVPVELSGPGLRPFGVLAAALTWGMGGKLLALPLPVNAALATASTFVGAAAGVWGAWRLVDVFAAALADRASATETRFDDLLIPLVRSGAKAFVLAFGVVFIASNLNVNISSLLAGLGIGGLAFALAAQDTVKNVFGTATVILDRPFDVGDWVKIGEVEGTVESVGLRSTRVRTFYDSVVTVPNSNLLSAVVDNLGARGSRRFKMTVSITYGTPADTIDRFCEGIRELVRTHPHTRKEGFHIYLQSFATSSLDILLYVFLQTPDWGSELRERHALMLDILRLAERLGVGLAFPTQTIHMAPAADDRPRLDAPRFVAPDTRRGPEGEAEAEAEAHPE